LLKERDNTIRESLDKMESFEHVENQLDEQIDQANSYK